MADDDTSSTASHEADHEPAALARVDALQQAVEQQRNDLALALDGLARMAEAIERTDDRLAAVVGKSLGQSTDELAQHLTTHSEAALAGALRLIDARLADLGRPSPPMPPRATRPWAASRPVR
jgi:hypothetical protein